MNVAHREWLGNTDRTGPVLIVLNTVIGDSRTFSTMYRQLAERCAVLLVDVTNQGGAPYTGHPISLEQQAIEVRAAVVSEGIKLPVWVGNSASTSLACRLAATTKTHRLILLSPLLSIGMERRIELVRKLFLESFSDESLTAFHRLLTLLISGSSSLEKNRFVITAGLSRLRELFTLERLAVIFSQSFFSEMDSPDLLRHIPCPILVVRGDEEMLQPITLLHRSFAELNVTYETVACGHNIVEEAACATFDAIFSFLWTPKGVPHA